MTTATGRRVTTRSTPAHTGPQAAVYVITPELAATWLDEKRNRRNRKIREAHVATLARDMVAGDWQLTGESIKWQGDPDAGDALLLDGQHRLEAVLLSGVTIQSFVTTGLKPDAQEVMDTNLRRSAKNALELEDFEDPSAVAALARMVLLWDQGAFKATDYNGPKTPTNTEIVKWAREHPEAADAVALGKKYFIRGMAYAARVFAVYKLLQVAGQDEVAEFLDSIAHSRQLAGDGDPRYALINRLRFAEGRKERIPRWVQANMLFRAWNYYHRGQQMHNMLLTSGGSGPNSKKWILPETEIIAPGAVVRPPGEEEDAELLWDVVVH